MFPAVAVPDFITDFQDPSISQKTWERRDGTISKIHNNFLSNKIKKSFSPACSTQTAAHTCINGAASACSDLPAPKMT